MTKTNHKRHIRALEKCLKTSKDFSKVADCYFTCLEGDEKFFEKSVVLEEEHELILKVVKKIAGSIFTDKPQIQHTLLSRFSGSDFIHGSLIINHHLSSLIFFEKSEIGMLMITLLNRQMHFFRFSTTVYRNAEGLPYYGNIFGSETS